jgi:orotidine-5'-phosphate decarboxylase
MIMRPRPAAMADRLIVALDVPTIAQARELVAQLDGITSFYKIGLWLAFADGIDAFLADLVRAGKQVFLDCKMFDIGQTVEQGVARAADRGVAIVTVHGEPAMLEAAVRGKGTSNLNIFAISVLTSMTEASVAGMGYRLTLPELVALRARTAVACGCDGLIASPADNPNTLRTLAGSQSLLIATPGVRQAGAATHDQARIGTPAEAIANGADYLIVGRPIIQAADPLTAARGFIAEMESPKAREAVLSSG